MTTVLIVLAVCTVDFALACCVGRALKSNRRHCPLPQSTVPTDVPAVTHSGQPPAPGVADSTTP